MKLAEVLKIQELQGAAAGTQATSPDSRSADEWIKGYLDRKNKRLNDLRESLHRLLDYRVERTTGDGRKEIEAAFNVYKDVSLQDPDKVASGGQWAVTDLEGLIISTWDTEEEANMAAFPLYKGIAPSSTGATAGARVKKLEAADIFQNEELGDRTRAKFLKHPKPPVVKLADWLRTGDHRPSSAGGAAGNGGTGGGGGTS
jgi:hypothetical protein